jgi:hypothetical protein
VLGAAALSGQAPGQAPAPGGHAQTNDAQKTDCAHFLPYSQDRNFIWNRVHRRLLERKTSDGKILGCDEVDLLLWASTKHVLVEPAYSESVRLLDEFIDSHAERLVRDPLRRAIFQHDLWAFFDWLTLPAEPQAYPEQREQLEWRIAKIIKAVALSRSEIEQLPDNLAGLRRTRPAGELPELPDTSAGWVLVGRDDGEPPAQFHSTFVDQRAVFLVYLKLPDGAQTSAYLEQLRSYSRTRGAKEDCLQRPCRPPQFPVGTQVALIRRAMLIDTSGQPVCSPITESIQLRRYREVPAIPNGYLIHRDTTQRSRVPQPVAEFRWRRALLLAGKPSLHQVGEDETAFDGGGMIQMEQPFGFDYVERYGDTKHLPLRFCAGCHEGPGVTSFMSYAQLVFGDRRLVSLHQSDEAAEQAVAIKRLELQTQWKRLHKLLQQ